MSGYSKKIEGIIGQMPYNKLIVASELYNNQLSDIPELTYYKTLERLSKKGLLRHITKGIYYKPEITESGTEEIREEDIIDYYIENSSGVVVGNKLYRGIGITEQAESKIEVLSTKLNEEKKNISNVEIRRLSLELNKETTQMIKLLDIIQNYQKIVDINKKALMRYFAYYCHLYCDDAANYVINNKKYKKSTIAFLANILDKFGVAHTLHKYLSPLSNYKIPILEKEGKDMPGSIVSVVNNFAENIKKIFGNKLSKIVLYGSYARGDYQDNSDVDIMILVKISDREILNYENKVYDLAFDIQMETGTDISPIIQNEAHFEYWVDALPFYRNVRDEGIVISG